MIKRRIGLLHIIGLIGISLIVFWAARKQITSSPSKGDIDTYLHASRLLLKGENIYGTPNRGGPDYYVYPPLLATLLIPLTVLPLEFVIYLWCALKILLIVWMVRALEKALTGIPFSELSRKEKYIFGFFPILMTARFILHDLSYGQAHIFMLGLMVLGLTLALKGGLVRGGICTGISIALKVVSLPFVIWFLIRKEFRALFGILVGVSAALFAPSLIVGVQKNLSYLSFWLNNIILDKSRRSLAWSLPINFSLDAQLKRFFSDAVAFNYKGQAYRLTVFLAPPSYLEFAPLLIMVVVAMLICLYALKYKNRGRLIANWGGVALTFSLIPIFSPVTLEHHFLVLLPANFYVVYLWHSLKLRDKWFRGLVLASFILNVLTAELFVGNDLRNIFMATGCLVWGTLLLAASIFRAASCLPKAPPTPSANRETERREIQPHENRPDQMNN